MSSLEDFPTKVPALPDLQAVRELAWALSGLGRRRTFGVPRTCAVHDCPVQVGVGGQEVVYHRNVGGGPRNPSRSRSGLWTLIEAFPRSLRLRFRKARTAMISIGPGFGPRHQTSDVNFVTTYPSIMTTVIQELCPPLPSPAPDPAPRIVLRGGVKMAGYYRKMVEGMQLRQIVHTQTLNCVVSDLN